MYIQNITTPPPSAIVPSFGASEVKKAKMNSTDMAVPPPVWSGTSDQMTASNDGGVDQHYVLGQMQAHGQMVGKKESFFKRLVEKLRGK